MVSFSNMKAVLKTDTNVFSHFLFLYSIQSGRNEESASSIPATTAAHAHEHQHDEKSSKDEGTTSMTAAPAAPVDGIDAMDAIDAKNYTTEILGGNSTSNSTSNPTSHSFGSQPIHSQCY